MGGVQVSLPHSWVGWGWVGGGVACISHTVGSGGRGVGGSRYH